MLPMAPDVQVHIGEELKGKYDNNTQFAVNTGQMDTNIGKQAGDKTGASKQGNPAVSPDKRRAHQAHDDKNVDKPFPTTLYLT